MQVLETSFNEMLKMPDATATAPVNDRPAENQERPEKHLLVRTASIDIEHKFWQNRERHV